jgi:hypothetical protein
VLEGGAVSKVFFPVSPSDRNAGDVLQFLQRRVAA